MILSNLDRILASLSPGDLVLDVGGWAAPLNRADWVLDLMPYETRGVTPPHSFGPGPERFTPATWVQRDMCDRDPWPFEDDQFDFVFTVMTIEDLRDPIGVCREMQRVGKRGYVEVPSLLDELTWAVDSGSGGTWCGHRHHRWIVIEEDGELVFHQKSHNLHSDPRVRLPRSRADELTYDQRCMGFFWEGELRAREHHGIYEPLDLDYIAERLLAHFPHFTEEERLAFAAEQRALTATRVPAHPPGLLRRARAKVRRP